MQINPIMQSLKVFYEETNPRALELIKKTLEATGKFVVVLDVARPTNIVWKFGSFLFNSEIRILQWKEEEPALLTARESKILTLLLENAGRVVTRRRILSSFWGDTNTYASRSLDIFIYRLRQKLKRDSTVVIRTIRSEGFMLTY
jgi:DNA-binding response OmpR family regulator